MTNPIQPDYSPGKYERHAADIDALVDRKNAAYGDSFRKSGDVFRILYPHGIKPEQLDDALVLVRIVSQNIAHRQSKNSIRGRSVRGYCRVRSVNVAAADGQERKRFQRV
jgi:hypothetical protein